MRLFALEGVYTLIQCDFYTASVCDGCCVPPIVPNQLLHLAAGLEVRPALSVGVVSPSSTSGSPQVWEELEASLSHLVGSLWF